MRQRLHLFIGEDEQSEPDLAPEVSIRLDELARILSDAELWNRTWLRDFGDEKVKVPADLYELMMVYREMRSGA